MPRYALNLPVSLKQDAEQLASVQGVSLNQFILWAVAEKVGALHQRLDDPAFPRITYRRGASGQPQPVLRGSGIRVQAIVVAHYHWHLTPAQIAAEYELDEAQIGATLDFYQAHRAEIDCSLQLEESLASAHA
jgi:uncharacterized protein (DUF433 family)